MHRLAIVEKILERDHEQECRTERRDSHVRLFYVFAVLRRIEKRKFRNDKWREPRRGRDDEYRQDEASTEHGHGDAPHEEAALPARVHPTEHLRVHHGIVERECRFEDGKQKDQKEGGESAPEKRRGAYGNGYERGKNEYAHGCGHSSTRGRSAVPNFCFSRSSSMYECTQAIPSVRIPRR